MNTRANGAADNKDETVPARVILRTDWGIGADRKSRPLEVEIEGAIFRREEDQDAAHRAQRQSETFGQLRTMGADAELLNNYTGLIHDDRDAREETFMRAIADILTMNGRWDLWQLVYCEWRKERTYVVGDEYLFRLHEPVSDDNGYKGPPPPGSRFNSALEAVQKQRARTSE
ncbi:MAG: hypothetical protein ACR2IK_05705 [Chloroflexota bacterium]